jgi:uncharacterized protein YqhQ
LGKCILTIISIGCLGYLIYYAINIKRIYQYHGTEHKIINAYENGLDINLENARKASRRHMRCGTIHAVFLLFFIVMLYFLIPYYSVIYLLSLGLSYELLIVKDPMNNKLSKYFYKVGLWLQEKLTTFEPTDEELEVGIACIKELICKQTEYEQRQ